MVKISSTTAGNSVFDAETITNLYLYGSVSTPDNLYDRIKSSDYVNSLQFQGGVRSVTLDIVVDDFFTQGAGRFALPALDPTIQFFFNTSADNFEAGEYSFDDIRQVFSDLNLGAPLSLILPDSFQLEHAFVSDGMGQEEEDERAYIFNNSSFQLDDNVATDLTFVVEYDAATDTYTRYIENVRVLAFDDNFDLEGGSFSSLIFNALFTADIDPFGIGNRVEFVYRNDNPLDAVYSASDFQADTQSINGFSQTFPVTTSFADFKEGLETNGVLEYENDQFLIEYGTHLNDQLGSIFADKSLLLLGGEGIDTLWLSRSDGGRAYGHEGNDTINGSTGRDMIFGGSDSDILNGGDEADIIYGDFSPENYRGAEEPNGTFGIDMIDGGRGMDFLYGGGEADVINGGRGDFNDVLYHNDAGNLEDAASDRLMGGDGQDGYFVGDADVIFDSDGKGSVVFGNILLTGGDLVAETADACSSGENDNQSDDERTWRNKETGETYRLSNGNLIVEHDGSSITIESWESDQLGITLNDESPSDGGDCQPPESDPDGDGGDGGGGGNGSPDAFASPLVLDLDGDGLDLTLLERSVAFFDIDSDGIRERTSWVGADDGLLVLDRNGNGLIDSGQELFGYGETVSGG